MNDWRYWKNSRKIQARFRLSQSEGTFRIPFSEDSLYMQTLGGFFGRLFSQSTQKLLNSFSLLMSTWLSLLSMLCSPAHRCLEKRFELHSASAQSRNRPSICVLGKKTLKKGKVVRVEPSGVSPTNSNMTIKMVT